MRVLASNSQVADDFDARVIFSSNWPSARAEFFTATINSFSDASAKGSFTLSRPYKTYPVIFAVFVRDNGTIYYPYFFQQKYIQNTQNGGQVITLERLEQINVDVASTGGNSYRIDYNITAFGAGNNLGNGVLYVRACGQGV